MLPLIDIGTGCSIITLNEVMVVAGVVGNAKDVTDNVNHFQNVIARIDNEMLGENNGQDDGNLDMVFGTEV